MTETMLLRLAMVLQDKAPSTLDKYICKLAASILVDFDEEITIDELCGKINEQFNLDFTIEEISSAIERKGPSSSLIIHNGSVKLVEKAAKALKKSNSLAGELKEIIRQFAEASETDVNEAELQNLLTTYLYACFNSNVDNLLALFDRRPLSAQNSVFEASNEEIALINEFLSWDNNEKDSLIYRIVATCYEYCMLTIKKDSVLSRELFRGKRFYLDANIIFRMAGINNEERQFVTKSFEKHCNDAGIELICTSSTLDEIYRVIESAVKYIKGLTGSEMPVNSTVLERLNPSIEVNDFYKRYYEWCQKPENQCGDFLSFSQYLFDLLREVITNLSIKSSGSYKIGKGSQLYEDNVKNLIDFKNNQRRGRNTTRSSAETDVTNILDLLDARKGNGTSIWQTNDYIVSADHRLIEWANMLYPGVPLAVLPSVWLSIILRYTGRSDDDYRSFCLFLTQRQHRQEGSGIDTSLLLRAINTKTAKTVVKEKIIAEITLNKNHYSFNSQEEYDSSANKAFDVVLAEYDEEHKSQLIAQREELSANAEKNMAAIGVKKDKEKDIAVRAEQEKTVLLLAKERAHGKTKPFAFLQNNEWLIYLFGGIVLVLGVLAWAFEWEPLYSWGVKMTPTKAKQSVEVFGVIWTIASAGVSIIIIGLGKLISYLGSEKREKRLCEKYYKRDLKKVRSVE